MQRVAAAIAAFVLLSTAQAFAGDEPPTQSFFILMRAPDLEPAPRYISIYEAQSDAASEPVAGCDGKTYYAAYDDLSVVNAALANGNIVELMRGDLGVAPEDAGVTCIVRTGP
jgi:hypothetical protein